MAVQAKSADMINDVKSVNIEEILYIFAFYLNIRPHHKMS